MYAAIDIFLAYNTKIVIHNNHNNNMHTEVQSWKIEKKNSLVLLTGKTKNL